MTNGRMGREGAGFLAGFLVRSGPPCFPPGRDAASEPFWLHFGASFGARLRRLHGAFSHAYALSFALMIGLLSSCM